MSAALIGLATRARLNVAASLGARVLEAGAKFGLYALAARALGGPDAGRFFLTLSVVHIVSTVARLGLEKPLTRHVAAELAVGRPSAAKRAAVQGSGAIIVVSTLAGILLAAGAPVIATEVLHQPDMVGALILAGLIVPVQNLAYALAYILVGLERSGAAQMVMNALAPALSLAALLGGANDLGRLLVAYAGAFGICVVIGIALLLVESRRLAGLDVAQQTLEPLPSLWSGAKPLLVVEVSQAALLSLPVMIIGAFGDPTAISVFSIASRLSMLVTIVVLSLGAMSAPAFARHYHRSDWPALREAATRNRRLTIAFCLPLVAALAIGGGPLLNQLGVSPASGLPVLLILLCGQLVFCLLPSRDTLLAMAGEGRILRRLSLWQVAFCSALCLALIPRGGATGAAVASATIWIGGAVALAIVARRRIPDLRP
ncbi:oligosaccharide flippase family protein [soil metagenome]